MTQNRPTGPEGGPPGSEPGGASAAPTCYRHRDRETYIRCQRCDRPICPECMRPAAVGFQCPECVAQGQSGQRATRTAYGGRPHGRPDVVTKALVVANVLVFGLVLATGGTYGAAGVRLAMVSVPGFLPGVGTVGGVADGELWRLLTSVFVHAQPLHLLFNMVALWVFGPPLEAALGRLRFAGLYLVSGLGGSVLVYLLANPKAFTIGASGAVFGLLGAALVVGLRRRMDVTWLLVMLGLNLVITFQLPGISWQGHLGGLVTGLALATALVYAPRQRRDLVQGLAFAAVLLGCLLAVLARTASLTG